MSVCSETILLPAGGKAPGISPTVRCPGPAEVLRAPLAPCAGGTVPCPHCALSVARPRCSVPCWERFGVKSLASPAGGEQSRCPAATQPSAGKARTSCPTPPGHLQSTHACRSGQHRRGDAPCAHLELPRTRSPERCPGSPRGEHAAWCSPLGCHLDGPAARKGSGSSLLARCPAASSPGRAIGAAAGRPGRLRGSHLPGKAKQSKDRASSVLTGCQDGVRGWRHGIFSSWKSE